MQIGHIEWCNAKTEIRLPIVWNPALFVFCLSGIKTICVSEGEYNGRLLFTPPKAANPFLLICFIAVRVCLWFDFFRLCPYSQSHVNKLKEIFR